MMLTRKTVLVFESDEYRKHVSRMFEMYKKQVSAEVRAQIDEKTKFELDCEFDVSVPVIPVDYGRADLEFVIRGLRCPVKDREIRHITEFIDFMTAIGVLDLKLIPDVSESTTSFKNREYYMFLDRVSHVLKTFPGKKEVTQAAYEDFKKTWFDSVSSIKYAVMALTVPVDAVIVSGNIVRVALAVSSPGKTDNARARIMVFEHVSLEFKANWRVYVLGEHERWYAEDFVATFMKDNPGIDGVSRILAVPRTKAKTILTKNGSPLAAFLAQVAGV